MTAPVSSSPASSYPSGLRSLHEMMLREDVTIAEFRSVINPSTINQKLNGNTPLHLALQFERFAVAELLIELGADPFIRGAQGQTALHLSATKNQENLVRALCDIAKPGDIDIQDSIGKTALYEACELGHVAIVNLLLERNANMKTESQGRSPVDAAFITGKIELVEAIISHLKSYDEEVGYSGDTCLHLAAAFNMTDVIRFLLREKANPNAETSEGFTPLLVACQTNNFEAAKLLLEGGAECHPQNGNVPLLYACQWQNGPLVKLLCDSGADPDRETQGTIPLFSARYKDYPEIVENLLAAGASPEARNQAGEIPRTIAERNGSSNLVRLLSVTKMA